MNCYVCHQQGHVIAAVAACHNCSVALCREHLDADLLAPRPQGHVRATGCSHHPATRAARRKESGDTLAGMVPKPIDLNQKLSAFEDRWSPKVVARLNDYEIKLAKFEGEFVWHSHAETDELFFVLEGGLEIEFRDGAVHLERGQLLVVPRGVEHRPVAHGLVHAMLIEPIGVVNTGEAGGGLTAGYDDSLA